MRILFVLITLFFSLAHAGHYVRFAGDYRATLFQYCSDGISNQVHYDLALNRDNTFTSKGIGSYDRSFGPDSRGLVSFNIECNGEWTREKRQVKFNSSVCVIQEVNLHLNELSGPTDFTEPYTVVSEGDTSFLQFPARSGDSFIQQSSAEFLQQTTFFGDFVVERRCTSMGSGVLLRRRDNSELPVITPIEPALAN